jgi:hypothetical protein
MTHEQLSELLGAYALDALDGDELVALEAHLPTCPRCRAELRDHREVAALLANAGGDAPPGLWDRIAGSLDDPPPPLELAPVVALPAARRAWLPAVAIAAAAALVIAGLGIQVRHQGQEIAALESAMAAPLTGALANAFEAALDDPSSRLFALRSDDGQLVVRGAVTDDGTGYLRASALPALPDARTYQLWGQTGDRLVSLGVLGDRPMVVAFRAAGYPLLAVTEEVAGGVVQSRNAPVVVGRVAATAV